MMTLGLTARFQITVTMYAYTPGAERADGGEPASYAAPVVIPGCYAWPSSSTENAQGQDSVITSLQLALPAGTVVKSRDAFDVLGARFEVAGDAFPWFDYGVQVALIRAH